MMIINTTPPPEKYEYILLLICFTRIDFSEHQRLRSPFGVKLMNDSLFIKDLSGRFQSNVTLLHTKMNDNMFVSRHAYCLKIDIIFVQRSKGKFTNHR